QRPRRGAAGLVPSETPPPDFRPSLDPMGLRRGEGPRLRRNLARVVAQNMWWPPGLRPRLRARGGPAAQGAPSPVRPRREGGREGAEPARAGGRESWSSGAPGGTVRGEDLSTEEAGTSSPLLAARPAKRAAHTSLSVTIGEPSTAPRILAIGTTSGL